MSTWLEDVIPIFPLEISRWIVTAGNEQSLRASSSPTANMSSTFPYYLRKVSSVATKAWFVEVIILYFVVPTLNSSAFGWIAQGQVLSVGSTTVLKDTLFAMCRCIILQGLAPLECWNTVPFTQLVVLVYRRILEYLDRGNVTVES